MRTRVIHIDGQKGDLKEGAVFEMAITLVCDGERGMSGKSTLRRNEREVEIPGMWERSCVALNSQKKSSRSIKSL